MNFNIPSQIVVQTAAQWALDATVYSAKRILITSDEFYTGTDQRKIKIPNGVDTWSNLDYLPIQTSADVSAAVAAEAALRISGDAATLSSANAYSDSLVIGLWDDRGNFDASGGAYPSSGGSGTAGAILKGDTWTISVAGTLPTGQIVEIGDVVRALINTPGNTQANWAIQQNNIGYTAENSANKSTDVNADQASNTKYPTVKAVYDWAVGLFQTLANLSTNVISDQASNIKYPSVKAVYDWIVAGYQAILVSGTNIKSLNGRTILGSGDFYETAKSLFSINATVSTTGSVTENILYNTSPNLKNVFDANDTWMLNLMWMATNDGNTKTIRFYISDSQTSLVNSVLIGTATATTGAATNGFIQKIMWFRNAVSSQLVTQAASASFFPVVQVSTSIDFTTDKYLIVTAQNSNAGNTISLLQGWSLIHRK